MLDVDICNQALYRLGVVNPITSLDEDSTEAAILRSHYAPSRDALLSAFPWPWARRVVALARLAGDDHPVWRYAYAYPPLCLRILELFNAYAPERVDVLDCQAFLADEVRLPRQGEQGLPVNYEITSGTLGKRILTNLADARCTYIHRVEDPLLWSSLFQQALAARLASDVCLPVTGSDSRLGNLQELAQRAYYAAIGAEASETRESRRRRNRYVKARR